MSQRVRLPRLHFSLKSGNPLAVKVLRETDRGHSGEPILTFGWSRNLVCIVGRYSTHVLTSSTDVPHHFSPPITFLPDSSPAKRVLDRGRLRSARLGFSGTKSSDALLLQTLAKVSPVFKIRQRRCQPLKGFSPRTCGITHHRRSPFLDRPYHAHTDWYST
jgi:hypothetical protein